VQNERKKRLQGRTFIYYTPKVSRVEAANGRHKDRNQRMGTTSYCRVLSAKGDCVGGDGLKNKSKTRSCKNRQKLAGLSREGV